MTVCLLRDNERCSVTWYPEQQPLTLCLCVYGDNVVYCRTNYYLHNHCKQVVHFDRLKPSSRESWKPDSQSNSTPMTSHPKDSIHTEEQTTPEDQSPTRGYRLELVEEDSDQALPTESLQITPPQLAVVPQPVAPQPVPKPPPVRNGAILHTCGGCQKDYTHT